MISIWERIFFFEDRFRFLYDQKLSSHYSMVKIFTGKYSEAVQWNLEFLLNGSTRKYKLMAFGSFVFLIVSRRYTRALFRAILIRTKTQKEPQRELWRSTAITVSVVTVLAFTVIFAPMQWSYRNEIFLKTVSKRRKLYFDEDIRYFWKTLAYFQLNWRSLFLHFWIWRVRGLLLRQLYWKHSLCQERDGLYAKRVMTVVPLIKYCCYMYGLCQSLCNARQVKLLLLG